MFVLLLSEALESRLSAACSQLCFAFKMEHNSFCAEWKVPSAVCTLCLEGQTLTVCGRQPCPISTIAQSHILFKSKRFALFLQEKHTHSI